MFFFVRLQNASFFSGSTTSKRDRIFCLNFFFHFSRASVLLWGEKSVEVNFRKQLTSTARSWQLIENRLQHNSGRISSTSLEEVKAILHFLTFRSSCLSNLYAVEHLHCVTACRLVRAWAVEIACWSKASDVRIFCNNDKYFFLLLRKKMFACCIVGKNPLKMTRIWFDREKREMNF